jgi:hypothetical protein
MKGSGWWRVRYKIANDGLALKLKYMDKGIKDLQ